MVCVSRKVERWFVLVGSGEVVSVSRKWGGGVC